MLMTPDTFPKMLNASSPQLPARVHPFLALTRPPRPLLSLNYVPQLCPKGGLLVTITVIVAE